MQRFAWLAMAGLLWMRRPSPKQPWRDESPQDFPAGFDPQPTNGTSPEG
jgi:hypothetical protein